MRFSLDSLILVIVALVIVGAIGLIVISSIYQTIYHPCVHYHAEQQIENAPAVVVGGSKYGGGIAMPLGNGRIVNVQVCDKNK